MRTGKGGTDPIVKWGKGGAPADVKSSRSCADPGTKERPSEGTVTGRDTQPATIRQSEGRPVGGTFGRVSRPGAG